MSAPSTPGARSARASGRLLLAAATLVAAGALLAAGEASAYRISKSPSGADIHWPDGAFPVRFTYHSAGSADVGPDATHQTWTRAFETWQSVDCSFVTYQVAGTSNQADAVGGDGVNTVVFYEDRWFQGADGALAVTTPIFEVQSGEIGEADVVFNGAIYQWGTNGAGNLTDLEAVSAHEFGHAFGLDHPCEIGGQGGAPDCCEYVNGFCQPIGQYYAATMFPATDAGNTSQRTLDEDDVAGICFLYDSGRPHMPPELGGLGDPCTSGEDCQSELCVGLPDGTGVCTELCEGTCSEPGFVCEPLQGGGGACLRDPNLLGFGAACETGEQCASGQCVDDGTGGRFCTQACGECPDGYECGEGFCRRGGGKVPGGGGVGSACADTVDCQSGLSCVNDGRNQYCTTSCAADPDCGGGFQCINAVCVFTQPAGGNTGDACGAPTDCLTGQCINDGMSQYCSQGCTMDGECPGGFSCFDVGGTGVCARSTTGGGNMGTPDGGGEGGGCSQVSPASAAGGGVNGALGFLGLMLLVSVMAIPILARRPR